MSVIPTGVIVIWPGTNASIPAGFTRETSLDDLHPKSTVNGVNPGASGGSATHTHTSPAHTHTMVSHNHTGNTNGPTNSDASQCDNSQNNVMTRDNHSHAYNISGVSGGNLADAVSYAAASSQPPYYEVIYIRATAYKLLPSSAVILHSINSVPSGYHLCNGAASTPDFRNTYLKGAGAGNDAGATGGSVNHQHAINHTHTGQAHSHSGNSGYASETRNSNDSTTRPSDYQHVHSISLQGNSPETGSAYVGNAGIADTVEPLYKKVIALQNTSGGNKTIVKGMIGLWLGTLATIPLGWYACDGYNGTIDLTGHYVKIAVDGTEIEDTGGANAHTHAASNSHTHTAAGTHTHTANNTDQTNGDSHPGSYGNEGLSRNHYHTISSVSNNTSSWNNATVTANSSNNEPPYLTASYIQYDHQVGGGLFFGQL
jgi:hypothetical protein